MCGRYSEPPNSIYKEYDVELPSSHERSFNVLPFSDSPIITKNSPLTIRYAKWGLIPSWSKEFKVTFTTFNARKDGLLESRIYKKPFLSQRCLVLASAFYEWQTLSDKEKIRYVVRPKDREFFSFAGFYEIWKNKEDKEFYSYTIVTDEPTSKFKKIHHREACILNKEDEQTWLDQGTTLDNLMNILHPCPDKEIEFFPAKINSIKRDMDSKELLLPA